MTIGLYTETDRLEISAEQARRLVAAGLAFPNESRSGVPDLDGTLRAVQVYAYPGFDLTVADRWFAQAGGRWMAVAAWESEDDWFADAVADGEDLPTPRVRDIHDPPATGTLVYVLEGREGRDEVERPLPGVTEPEEQNTGEPTWLFCGHWENDRIVIDYVLPGDQTDEREDTGRYEQGLWAASASGRTQNIARAGAIAEYESDGSDQPDHRHASPNHEHAEPLDAGDVNDHLADAHEHNHRYTASEARDVHADLHDATPTPATSSELERHLRDGHHWDHPFEPDEAQEIHDLLHEGDL